jgi:biotin transport system substrate-specific component
MILGNLAIYVIGIPVVWYYYGAKVAFMEGLFPFLPGDLLKILVATLLLPTIWRLLALLFNRKNSVSFTYRHFVN